jgi:hypothetical protein
MDAFCIRKMKPAEIVLRRGGKEKRENYGWCKSKLYHKHICKHYNVSPCAVIC